MKKIDKFLTSSYLSALALTTLISNSVFADTSGNSTQTPATPSQTPSANIPGLSNNPNFKTGDPSFNTELDAGKFIHDKSMLLLSLIFSVATVVIIIMGVVKGLKLSSSSAKTRGDAISDLIWWIVGAAICFAAALITGAVYVFSQYK